MLTILDQSFLLPSLISKEKKASSLVTVIIRQQLTHSCDVSIWCKHCTGHWVTSRQVLSGHAILSPILVVMKVIVSDNHAAMNHYQRRIFPDRTYILFQINKKSRQAWTLLHRTPELEGFRSNIKPLSKSHDIPSLKISLDERNDLIIGLCRPRPRPTQSQTPPPPTPPRSRASRCRVRDIRGSLTRARLRDKWELSANQRRSTWLLASDWSILSRSWWCAEAGTGTELWRVWRCSVPGPGSGALCPAWWVTAVREYRDPDLDTLQFPGEITGPLFWESSSMSLEAGTWTLITPQQRGN